MNDLGHIELLIARRLRPRKLTSLPRYSGGGKGGGVQGRGLHDGAFLPPPQPSPGLPEEGANKTRHLWAVGALLMLAGLFSAGCGAHPDFVKGRMPDAPKPPPAYPAMKNVPLDETLRASAQQELAAALHSSDPEVRAHAIEAVRQTSGVKQSGDILAALDDPAPLVRYAACLAAGELQLREAHEKLLQFADDKDAAVRVVARYALHRIGDTRLSHDLENLSRDPQPQVRGTTAMVLGMLGDPTALKVLKGVRLDSSAPVRQQAAEAMWRLGSEQGLRDLVGWSVSRYPDDEMIGLLGLAVTHNRNVIEHIRGGLTTDWPEVNLVAARAMGMLGCDEGYGVAQLGAKSSDPRQRLLASVAFGAIRRTDAQETLRMLLGDADPNVKVAAAEAILQLDPSLVIECSRKQ